MTIREMMAWLVELESHSPEGGETEIQIEHDASAFTIVGLSHDIAFEGDDSEPESGRPVGLIEIETA